MMGKETNVRIRVLRGCSSIKWERHEPLDSTTGTVSNHNNVGDLCKIDTLKLIFKKSYAKKHSFLYSERELKNEKRLTFKYRTAYSRADPTPVCLVCNNMQEII